VRDLIQQNSGRKRNFVGLHFGARGYCASTAGLDEAMGHEYIRTQEEYQKKEEQIQLDYVDEHLAGP
jgi:putative transposase